MLKNYLRAAWRNLANNKFYSLLNIAGLAVGLAVGILILIWVNDELGFDSFHRKGSRIYRINTQLGTGISRGVYPVLQAPIAAYALKGVPGIENAVRINSNDDYLLFRYQDKELQGGSMMYTDPAFFKVFDFPLLKGSADNPFPSPESVVITETSARRFFGSGDPMGKVLRADNKQDFVVSGVLADFPANSSIRGDILFSTELYKKKYTAGSYWKSMDNDWGNYGWRTFLLLRADASTRSIEDKLTTINVSHQPTLKPIDVGSYQLQPLTKIHLYAPDGSSAGMQTVKIFMLIALFILLIASINYINLSTARAMLRSREVSIRKIIGAGRRQLIGQFVLETALFFSIALIIAFGIMIPLMMPLFNEIAGKQMRFDLFDPELWRVAGITILICTLASSIYPALLLSSFRPINALKGKLVMGTGNARFRRVLVVCQFVFSIALITGTLIVNRQLAYIRGKQLGYDKSYVFSFTMRNIEKSYDAVRSELVRQPGIGALTTASSSIVSVNGSTLDVDWDGKDKNASYFIHSMTVDKDYLSFFKMQLAEGRGFSGSLADSAHFILNETAVREAGMKHPVGTRLTYRGVAGTVIGVAKDFHFAPLREKIQPFVFCYQPVNRQLFVKTTGAGAPDAIRAVEKIWKRDNTDFPLDYTFMDASYDKLYKADQRTGALFNIFAVIAVLICCLGLFGLATYSAHVKVKEIGIRKVLGASVANILTMLSKDFILLVVISIVISAPLAWWAMNKWLEDFAYRAPVTWWVFAAAGGGALLVTLLTIGFQAVRAALANPVHSLRSE